MYLLNKRSFEEIEEELLKIAFKSVAFLGHGFPALEIDSSSKTSAKLGEEKLSEIAKETLKVLRGERSRGLGYDKLYSTSSEPSATIRRDVAQAMAHRWGHDGRGYGAFDEIALELFRDCFDRFEGIGAASFNQTGRGESKQLGFDGLRRALLDHFLEENCSSSLSVQFNLDAVKAPVRLKLEIGATGNAVWELRGASQLKRSHRKLRDDLQDVVSDFHCRRRWMVEYMGSEQA